MPKKRPSKKTASSFPISELAVGASNMRLKPDDERLFKAFQNNLVSLISHELRTPLTGILNALHLLEDAEKGEFSGEFTASELVSIARKNAEKLQHVLAALLDLASIESGTFQVRLRETHLDRLVRSRLEARRFLFSDRRIAIEGLGKGLESASTEGTLVLIDPMRLGRALDLCLEVIAGRARAESAVKIRISSAGVVFDFELSDEGVAAWKALWTQSVVGFQAGVGSPISAFSGMVQAEEAFLSRSEEGLGNELVLVHEILRRHQGKLEMELQEPKKRVSLQMELPRLSSSEALRAVIASRAYAASSSLVSVAVALVEVPKNEKLEAFRARLKKSLFRASDAVYALPERGQLAVVIDDCRVEDARKILDRIETTMGGALHYAIAVCPDEATDPTVLLELIEKRL